MVKIDLPEELVGRIERRVQYTEFSSAEAYITQAMEELLSEIESQKSSDDLEEIDEAEVEERLESLGYLN